MNTGGLLLIIGITVTLLIAVTGALSWLLVLFLLYAVGTVE